MLKAFGSFDGKLEGGLPRSLIAEWVKAGLRNAREGEAPRPAAVSSRQVGGKPAKLTSFRH